MKFSAKAYFESVGGMFTLVLIGFHFGRDTRVIGITFFNIVLELEY